MNKLQLTKSEASNLMDALQEWFDVVQPKQLQDNETGLNNQRYEKLLIKFKKFLKD
jgi:hypothetical protein